MPARASCSPAGSPERRPGDERLIVWAFLAGGLLLFGLFALARGFGSAKPADIAFAVRTFVAVVSGLASTGLLLAGRYGAAVILLVATFLTIGAIRRSRRGADPWPAGDRAGGAHVSSIDTDLLHMTLDRETGEVDGRVKTGIFAGRDLGALGLRDLLRLLNEAAMRDPQSTALLESYLDARHPDWRESASSETPSPSEDSMTVATALEILGLEDGASVDAIKRAHRRLMARHHPDRGGSTWLAAQVNRAKDVLLERSDDR